MAEAVGSNESNEAVERVDVPGPDHRAEPSVPNRGISSAAVRKYLYVGVAVLAAIVAGLVVFGVIEQEQVEEWAVLTGSFLVLGTNLLAAVNTPTRE